MKREALLQRVKQAVHKVEPEADSILYGSRARGDAQAESDCDFLTLCQMVHAPGVDTPCIQHLE